MKKFLSILLSLTLLLSVVALPVWAVDAAAMYTETSAAEVSAGDTFTYTISLSGSYMGYACTIPVIDGLTVETITTSDTDLGKATNVDKKADGSYLLSVMPSFKATDAEKSLIATVTVKVNDDAPAGTITLSLDKVQVANSVGDKVADLQTHFASSSVVEKSVPVAGTGVALDQTASEMNIGDTLTLHATVSPDNADNKSVTWKSDNTTVAVVANGVVTAKAAGSANITVTTADGGFTASCAITVKEDDTPVGDAAIITVATVKGRAGKSVDVIVTLENNPGITGAILTINYNENFTLSNVQSGEALSSLTFADLAVPYLNPIRLSWDGLTDDTTNGVLVTLTFSIPDGTEVGDYPVTITYNSDDIYDEDFNDVPIKVVNGKISIINVTYGDTNGDGRINGKDITLLRRYITGGFDLSSFDQEAADVNHDGKINGKDITLIRRYITGGFGVVLN